MGQLNIKSDRADELVSRLVALTGESKTQAVVSALEERLARVEKEKGAAPGRHPDYEKRLKFMEELAAEVTAATPPHLRTSDHSDLYDENGTPK
ncbi:type II toxin-antitoxin system VapB family antitoxin [Roseomonas sp. AR75]|uniref:type II toxin-antitoxin system VapB family antitoxin n=1 Tax=Roseomonas sp. AR75 TaxID=2562311 RepID=UPI0010C0706F|nr:type II toxin-antitoxin system VapB family antitoxin [Roseomonas sp. AR75]